MTSTSSSRSRVSKKFSCTVLETNGSREGLVEFNPYDYRTGKPTHCIDDDCHRNSFFLLNNWIVVRFSEEQVVRYPESCCLELAGVIQRVTKIQRYSAAFREIPPLIPVPMWTSRQAKKMAKAKTRDTYLRAIKLKA